MKISSRTFVDEWGMLCFDVEVEEEDGSIMAKRLSVDDYLCLFQESVQKKKSYVAVPRLPKEVVWAAMTDEPDTFKAVILLPEASRPVFYCGQIIESVPFPALCAFVEVEGGRRMNTKLFAIKTMEKNAELFRYPFGNVSQDGRCCFGNIVVDKLRDAGESLRVTEAFLTGETNNDLWESIGNYSSQGNLFEDLHGKKRFPKNLLKKVGMTVQDLCQEKTEYGA